MTAFLARRLLLAGPALAGVLVETADRWQGLERSVVLVQHPLSGRAATTPFGLAAGRLCVMLSRHRVACLVLVRAGLEAVLGQVMPVGERVLGLDDDPEWAGWQTHLAVLEVLRTRGRVVALPAGYSSVSRPVGLCRPQPP